MNNFGYFAMLSSVFDSLQEEIDSASAIQDGIREKVKIADIAYRRCWQQLAQIHKTAPSKIAAVSGDFQASAEAAEFDTAMKDLFAHCRQYPFHKYHHIVSSTIQNYFFTIQLAQWASAGNVFTPEDLSSNLNITFESQADSATPDCTLEEYMHSLISLINELSRLAVNCVISTAAANGQSDANESYSLPLTIDKFVKDLQAGFMTLNLKNDSLRRRYDSIKYDVKKVEEVVYDLALRGLLSPQ